MEYEIKDQPVRPAQQDVAVWNWTDHRVDHVKPDCAIEIPEQECG